MATKGKKNLLKSTQAGADTPFHGPQTVDPAAGGTLVSMQLARIRTNTWNTKTKARYCGKEFEELKDSIEAKGLIQPILVRPVPIDADGADYEIVCGERRYKASVAIADENGGADGATIVCIVRRLSDEDAFDLTIIENLKRQDLDPLDEARQFQQFIDKRGADHVDDLAERVGVSASYVRRRLAVLELPGAALKAWQRGKMSYGHLEQLRRLKDKKQIARFVAQIVFRADEDKQYDDPYTIRELKRDIDFEAPALSDAIFDTSGCTACYSNSSVQKKLFESEESPEIKCLNPGCYKQKVSDHLEDRWHEEFRQFYGTNGFVFESAVSWKDYEYISKPRAACKKCEKFVTIVTRYGKAQHNHVCLKGHDCHKKTYNSGYAGNGDGPDGQDRTEKRAFQHGLQFREIFYQDALPLRFDTIAFDDLKMLHAELIALYTASPVAVDTILERLNVMAQRWETEKVLAAIIATKFEEAEALVREITINEIMKKSGPNTRRILADHLGIDLSSEWMISEDYLGKKTIAEMLSMGTDLGILTDPQAAAYAEQSFGHAKFDKLKKAELIKVFMNSGVDLAGKVPAEILE